MDWKSKDGKERCLHGAMRTTNNYYFSSGSEKASYEALVSLITIIEHSIPYLNHTNLAICHSNQSVNWKKKNIKLIIKIGQPFLFPKYWSIGQSWFARLASFHTIIINISNNIIMHQVFSSLISNEYPWQIIANRCMLTKLLNKHFQNKPKTVTSCSNLYNYLWHLLYLF